MQLSSSLVRRAALALAGAASLAAAPLAAQPFAPPAAGDTALRIVLLTMGQGDEVWERFGHNAIWVHDPVAGTDLAYNYGMFDFRQDNFILNFARGRMNYWMEGFDAYLTIDHYRRLNRSVWAQELNLTPAQARQVRWILTQNARPEFRFYRYDYYRDNCSTRVRDVLNLVLHDALKHATENAPSGTTYRWHTRRLVAEGPGSVPIYTAINIGLGPAADRPISKWDEMFLPMRLRDEVGALTVRGADGRPMPLVSRQRTLVTATRPPERSEPPHWLLGYLAAGVVIASAVALLARSARKGAVARVAFAAVSGIWLLFAGLGGVILLGLWVATDHAIAYANENLLQLSPLALPLVVLVPALGYGARWARTWGVRLAMAVAGLSVLGLLVQVLPWFNQVNGETIALALPANLAVAWAAWHLAAAPPVRERPAGPKRTERKVAA